MKNLLLKSKVVGMRVRIEDAYYNIPSRRVEIEFLLVYFPSNKSLFVRLVSY